MSRVRGGHSPARSPSRPHRRRSTRGRSNGDENGNGDGSNDNNKSSSPVPSPGSWNVDRGRSRVRRPSNPFSEDNLRRRVPFAAFIVWQSVSCREEVEAGEGDGFWCLWGGNVLFLLPWVHTKPAPIPSPSSSAADEISGETVAIKMVTRVFEKIQLAKRALREITLLRHFANHENITGLIDVDAVSPDFNEIYIFMESGQVLTNEHVQYFLYQILRGMKFIHSAGVIHRDLKPGNLLVNADCELKICDFGLSRGFDAVPDENATRLTEYVATRWYRAPEIMLAFPKSYQLALNFLCLLGILVDVWSIGCILGELLLGKPLFKGKDYVDQLNKILDILGSPDETIIQKIGSDKAQAYVRSLPFRRTVPFRRVLPGSDPLALDLMAKMLSFDPSTRVTVLESLEHPWLAAYHDESDEPECSERFERWREIEKLETLDDFRKALWDEIEDYRREVRGLLPVVDPLELKERDADKERDATKEEEFSETKAPEGDVQNGKDTPSADVSVSTVPSEPAVETPPTEPTAPVAVVDTSLKSTAASIISANKVMVDSPESQHVQTSKGGTDPVVTYARRSSIMQPSRQGSTYNSPVPSTQYLPTFIEGQSLNLGGDAASILGASGIGAGAGNSIAFPSTQPPGYVVPARSRTGSTVGGEVNRRLLRTLSTVSIHEPSQGKVGGLAGVAPIGKFIVRGDGEGVTEGVTEADAPPSEMPREFLGRSGEGSGSGDETKTKGDKKERKKFHVE
ncbi:CMGC/MAPK protein kinase [Coprinopsis cinerea okayama7|uniref:CMGC/MAPK protein kinase n=1 Tax=Coprinopsis cinerea (strain Okayama-7 / 130 / ATCC MYA-4618 / FGSC 9003) TaxID=240176 RepID=D6RNX0_COPC7|nr:CMGC/MAPK protein kinase [Coprinopsis cinerea okayama7\|eukprot:XP_002910888.1 CMGC/MAPK protein kinase [Coprinopsis cinerea okayama7\